MLSVIINNAVYVKAKNNLPRNNSSSYSMKGIPRSAFTGVFLSTELTHEIKIVRSGEIKLVYIGNVIARSRFGAFG